MCEAVKTSFLSVDNVPAVSALVHRALLDCVNGEQQSDIATATATHPSTDDIITTTTTTTTSGSVEAKSQAVYERLVYDLTREAIATGHDQPLLTAQPHITATVLDQLSLLTPDRPTLRRRPPLPRGMGRVKGRRRAADQLDELLAAELVSEESDWTDYGREAWRVKNELTQQLFDELISDTVTTLAAAVSSRAVPSGTETQPQSRPSP